MSLRPKTDGAPNNRLAQVLRAGLALKVHVEGGGPVLDAEKIEDIDVALHNDKRNNRARAAMERLAVRWRRWRERNKRFYELADELRLRNSAKDAPTEALQKAIDAHMATQRQNTVQMDQFKLHRRENPSHTSLDILTDDIVQLTLPESVSRGSWPIDICKDITAYCILQRRACTEFTFRQAVINGFLGDIPNDCKDIEGLQKWIKTKTLAATDYKELLELFPTDENNTHYDEHYSKQQLFEWNISCQASYFANTTLMRINSWRELLIELCHDMYKALGRKVRGDNYWRRLVEWCFESNIASWNHIQLAMFMDTAYYEGNLYDLQTQQARLDTNSALCGLLSVRCLASYERVTNDWLEFVRALRSLGGLHMYFMEEHHTAAPGADEKHMRALYNALRLPSQKSHFYIGPQIVKLMTGDPTAWWAAFIIAGNSFTEQWETLNAAMIESTSMLSTSTAKKYMAAQFKLGTLPLPPDMFGPMYTVEWCMNLAGIAACAYNMLPSTAGRQNVTAGRRGRRFPWEAYAEADDSISTYVDPTRQSSRPVAETQYYQMQRWVEALMIATMRQGDSVLPLSQLSNGIDNFVMPSSGAFYTARQSQPKTVLWWEDEHAYDGGLEVDTVDDARQQDSDDD